MDAAYEGPEPPLGSHIVTPRLGYRHHGLYCGKGQVVHFSGLVRVPHWRQWRLLPRLLRMSRIELIPLSKFCNDMGFHVVRHAHALYTPEEVVARARSRLREHGYAAFSNNCEHFVNWCIEGEPRSWLVWRMLFILAFAAGGVRVLMGMRPKPVPRNVRCLVRSGLVSFIGAMAMGGLTCLSLSNAPGLEDGEMRRRRRGRQAVWLGIGLGMLWSWKGVRTRARLPALLGVFVLPALSGMAGYLVSLPHWRWQRVSPRRPSGRYAGETEEKS